MNQHLKKQKITFTHDGLLIVISMMSDYIKKHNNLETFILISMQKKVLSKLLDGKEIKKLSLEKYQAYAFNKMYLDNEIEYPISIQSEFNNMIKDLDIFLLE